MAVHHPGRAQPVTDLQFVVRQMLTQAIENASFGSAGLRVHSNGWILIENGGLDVTGTARITGRLEGSGTLDWTGPWFLRGLGEITGDLNGTGKLLWSGPWDLKGAGKITGDTTGTGKLDWDGPWNLKGAGKITGNVDITGALDVKNRITLGLNGYLEAGPLRIDRNGAAGGRITSSGPMLMLESSGAVFVGAPILQARAGSFTDLAASGSVSANIKNFLIEHPTKLDYILRHGATESPVSGVEYWGEETLPESGEVVVSLPDYFEALTEAENRAVIVTARGFIADWGDIEDGAFTVTGKPGGRFSWLVKAERRNANFVVEEPRYGPLRE